MGVTGSRCTCFDKWWILTDNASLIERINVLERKNSTLETNNNTLHTKYATLKTEHDVLNKRVNQMLTDMDTLMSRIDHVDKKASCMVFQQSDLECDMVIIQP